MDIRGSLRRNRQQAEEKGRHRDVASLAGQEIHNLEFGARVGGHHAFVPASAAPASHAAEGRWSIQMVFQGANRVDEIALVRPVLDGEKIDVTATDGMDVPKPFPNQRVQLDREGKTLGAYYDFSQSGSAKNENEDSDNSQE
jgi:hypothetical protein